MDTLTHVKELGFHSLEDYHQNAFSRNIGFLSQAEMALLRHKRVAIPGLGGVGGAHFIAHVRTGFCHFNISDFDAFDIVNVNRQYGAKVSNFHEPKLDAMLKEARDINPYIQVNTFPKGVNEENIDEFLKDVDIIIDSLDIFVVDLRILLFQKAHEKGIPIVTAAPLGFGTSIIAFSPHKGMSFQKYFGIRKEMTTHEKFVRLVTGVAPNSLQAEYIDLLSIQPQIKRVPSLGAGCFMAAGAACAMSVKIILNRKGVRYAPAYFSTDPYLHKSKRGYLWGGNSNPLQKIKMYVLNKMLKSLALEKDLPPKFPSQTDASQTISYAIKEFIVQAGIQAPSGDNTQPWSFVFGEKYIEIKLNASADTSFFNFENRAAFISIGAVIENMRIAASAFQIECNVKYADNLSSQSSTIATVYLKYSETQTKDPLFNSIWERCTNRKLFSKRRIEPFAIEALKQIVQATPEAKLFIVEDRKTIKTLRAVATKAGIARTENPLIHTFLNNLIRHTKEETLETRTGFPVNNLEAGAAGNFFLRLTKKWSVMNFLNKFGASRAIADKVEKGFEHSGACILLTMPTNSVLDHLKGGQVLERLWLKLTDLGISAQPMTTMSFFNFRRQIEGFKNFDSKHHKKIQESFEGFSKIFPQVDMEKNGQIMLLRIGYSKGIKTWTLRKSAKTMIEPIQIKQQEETKRESLLVNQ